MAARFAVFPVERSEFVQRIAENDPLVANVVVDGILIFGILIFGDPLHPSRVA